MTTNRIDPTSPLYNRGHDALDAALVGDLAKVGEQMDLLTPTETAQLRRAAEMLIAATSATGRTAGTAQLPPLHDGDLAIIQPRTIVTEPAGVLGRYIVPNTGRSPAWWETLGSHVWIKADDATVVRRVRIMPLADDAEQTNPQR